MMYPWFYVGTALLMVYNLFFYFFSNNKINYFSTLFIGYLIFLVLHLVFISNINLYEIIDIKYFRTEGRMFLTFIPFIYFSHFGIKNVSPLKIFNAYYYVFAFFGILLIFNYLNIFDFDFLFQTSAFDQINGIKNDYLFKGTFNSKNAAANLIGAFLSIFFIVNKRYDLKSIILFILASIPLILTSSRQTFVALSIVAIYLFFHYESYKRINLKNLSYITSFILFFVIITTFSGDVYTRIFQLDINSFNIYYRLMSWAEAVNFFSQSPILGIGYNRFGDFNQSFIGIEGLFYFCNDGLFDWKSHYQHPHNLFLTVLAEQGLVGFIFLFGIFYNLFLFFKSKSATFYELSILGRVSIVYSIASCIFGNGIEGPSIGLPLGLISGYAYFLINNNIQNLKLDKEI